MLIPNVGAWMKKPNDRSGFWIDPGDVRLLVQVASTAAKGEIVCDSFPTVFPRDHVVNDVLQSRRELDDPAVFAPTLCSPPDSLFERLIHAISCRGILLLQGHFGLGFHEDQEIVDVEIILQFEPLVWGEASILCLGRKFVIASMIGRRKIEAKDMARQLERKAAALRFNHSFEDRGVRQHN
jgi:hypothetical protein